MISNNKNKSSKVLSLEDIIQKSKFRKNIDHLCLLEVKIQNHIAKPANLTHMPIKNFALSPAGVLKFQPCEPRTTLEANNQQFKKCSNFSTARSVSSNLIFQPSKQYSSDPSVGSTTHYKSFKTISSDQFQEHKQFKKSKQHKLAQPKSGSTSRKKTPKINEYLCINGASNNIRTIDASKPVTTQNTPRDVMPQYEIKKYQTIVELASQFQADKQKFNQFDCINRKTSAERAIQTKKYRSFMVTKYPASNNIRQKAVKCQSSSQHKLNHKLMPENLIKQKMQYKSFNSKQKLLNNNKVQNIQQVDQQKNKKMNKYQLILNINQENQQKKDSTRKKIKPQFFQKLDDKNCGRIFHCQNQFIFDQNSDELQESPNKTQTKGFKGTKLKPNQIKSRYFIPDFIKPSLDLLMFQFKSKENIKTEEKESTSKNDVNCQNINRTFQQLTQCLQGKQLQINLQDQIKQKQGLNLNFKSLEEEQAGKDQESEKSKEEVMEDIKKAFADEKKKKNRLKKIAKQRKKSEEAEICAWEEPDKKKNKKFDEYFDF